MRLTLAILVAGCLVTCSWAALGQDTPPVEPEPAAGGTPAPAGAAEKPAVASAAPAAGEKAPLPGEVAPLPAKMALDAEEGSFEADYNALAEAYGKLAADFESTLKDYMVQEVQARIDEAEAGREDVVSALRENESLRRRAAMDALESFIARYERYKNDRQYREHIADAMFRLAELLRDQAEYRMEMDGKLFDQRIKEYELGIRPAPPREAEADYASAIEMYMRVVVDFPEYRYRDMVLYLAGYYYRLSGKLRDSSEALGQLVREYPGSYYFMGGWMLIGHNAYDNSDYAKAIEAYGFVASKKENNESYEDALYRLGWACFEDFQYDRAIKAFLTLLDHGEEKRGIKKQRGLLRKEAVESIANSFVDESWDKDGLADFTTAEGFTSRALAYLNRGVSYEKDILRQYGDLLFDLADQKHSRQAVIVYKEYLRRHPMEKDNPLIHDRLVYSYFELSRAPEILQAERDEFARLAMEERRKMADAYGRGSKWAELHKYDAEALRLASSKLSINMFEGAQLLHKLAIETRDERGLDAALPYYREAAAAYDAYLTQFPDAAKYVEMYRNYADIYMFGLQDFRRAAELFGSLRDMDRPDNPYRQEAARVALEARAKLIEEAARKADPSAPIPEKLFDLQVGLTLASIEPGDPKDPTKIRKVSAVAIPQVVQDWMAEAQKLIDANFPGEENAKVRGTLSFSIAKIYLRYGHFEEARKRQMAVLDSYGQGDALLALYSCTDMARMYTLENDLDNLEKLTVEMQPGGKCVGGGGTATADGGDTGAKAVMPDVGAILTGIKDARLKGRFLRAGELIEKAKESQAAGDEKSARDLYSKAAFELETIADENPDFEKADGALIEAGRAFEQVKLYDKATRLYKRLVEEPRFKDSQFREGAIMSLAENYEKFFSFRDSVRTYQRIPKEYGKSDNVRRSMLKTAELQENDQDYVAAADTLEEYLKKYPGDEKAGKIQFLIAELLEKGREQPRAEAALVKFLGKYGRDGQFVVNSMTAQLKLGRWAEERGKKKDAQTRFADVVKLYPSAGADPSKKARSLCAEATFRLAESKFNEYASIEIVGKSSQQRTQGKKKTDKLVELETIYKDILKFGSDDWSIAAYYRAGALWKDLAEAFFNAEYPPDLPDNADAKYEYKIQLGDLKARFEDRARERWREGIEVAKSTGVYNEWAYNILVALNQFEEERLKYPLFREVKQFTSTEPVHNFPLGE
jgi:tetratricopeptide (TPR) repeat protein